MIRYLLVITAASMVALALASCGTRSRGGDIGEELPQFVYKHNPDYPHEAFVAGISGRVWIKALVSEEGRVLKVIVGKSSGSRLLDDAAVKAAYKNKFTPGIQEGKPIKVWVTYPIEFK